VSVVGRVEFEVKYEIP